MKKLYAPWRHPYVSNKKKHSNNENLKNNCVFCDKFEQDNDKENLILKRFDCSIVIMNSYPYNAGHLMVLPTEHKDDLSDVSSPVKAELMDVVTLSKEILQDVLTCEGFNIGINLGSAGGGGIPSHLHIHILPRWSGDTNFLATLGDIKLICSDLNEIYSNLKKKFDLVKIKTVN
jgi:ATP adenylyltransferase